MNVQLVRYYSIFKVSYQCHFLLAEILHWVFDLDGPFVARQPAECFFARVPGEDFLPKVLDGKANVSHRRCLGKGQIEDERLLQVRAQFEIWRQDGLDEYFLPIFRDGAKNLTRVF